MSNVMHARNGSLALSIRVDTNVASMGHRRNLSRVGRTPPRQVYQRAVSAFSDSTVSGQDNRASGTATYAVGDLGRQGNAYEVTKDEKDEESAGEDDGEFYISHSGFGSRSSRVFPFSASRDEAAMNLEEIDERVYDRDEDNEEMGEDDCTTPLLPESPAVPSTHASSLLSHGHPLNVLSSGSSIRGSRARRQSTKSSRNALRSLRSFHMRSRSSITKKPSVHSLAASIAGVSSSAVSGVVHGSTSASGSAPTPSSATPVSAAPTSFRTSSGSHYSHSQSHHSSSPATASRAGTGDSASSDSPSVFRFPPPPRVFRGSRRVSGGTVNSDAMVFPPPLPSAALTIVSTSSSEPTVRPTEMSTASTPMQAEHSESDVTMAETIPLSMSAPQLEHVQTAAQQIERSQQPVLSANANALARMRRTHRPAYGPRTRGSSVSSVSSFASANASVSGSGSGGSSSDATYLMPQEANAIVSTGARRLGLGVDDMRLSVVEESASSLRTASERVSVDDSAEMRHDCAVSETILPNEHGTR